MPKDTKTLGNSKARACESLGFVHKKGCARVLTQPLFHLTFSSASFSCDFYLTKIFFTTMTHSTGYLEDMATVPLYSPSGNLIFLLSPLNVTSINASV